MSSVTSMIRTRRWQWIGYGLRKEPLDDSKMAVSWLPPGKGAEED